MAKKILVIDDDSHVIASFFDRADDWGYTACGLTDPNRAMPVVRELRPDLIVCDVQMPVVDGRDILARVKADPALRAIPIIMTSDRMDEFTRELCLSYGAAAFLLKPVNASALLYFAGNTLGLHEARDFIADLTRVSASKNRTISITCADAIDAGSPV